MIRPAVVAVAVAVWAAAAAAAAPTNLTVPKVNPECEEHCEEPWLVVTAAEDTNTSLHHLWGVKGALSFLIAAGTGGPDVSVRWDDFPAASPSVTFQEQPSHVFGFVIPSLVLYNDAEDDGAFQGQNESVRVPVSDFTWRAEVLAGSAHQVAVEITTTHFQGALLPSDTRIAMTVSAYGEDGRSTLLPHLLHTPDSAQLDLILDNLYLNLTQAKDWKKARWGMDFVTFSSEHETKADQEDFGIKFHTQKSLDDEHTPGVFDLDQLTTAGARAENRPGGYLQWRPISYLSAKREISSATTPNINKTLPNLVNLTDSLKASLAYAILGDNLTLPGAAVTTVISFGQPKDGFYQAESYTTWTVAIGEGAAPWETFSTLIVVVISLGVVLPAAMFLVGCVVLTVRRYRRTHSLME